jgi:endoglucanase
MRHAPSIHARHFYSDALFPHRALVAIAGVVLSTLILVPPALATSSTSSNLFTGDQGSFDAGTGSWLSYTTGGALAGVSSPVQTGSGALSVKTAGSGPLDVWIGSGSGTGSWTPAVAGRRYTATAMVRGTVAGRTVAALEAFYDANGNTLTSVWDQPATLSTSNWTTIYSAVGIAPAGTAWIVVSLVFYKTNTGELNYVDTVSLKESTVSFSSIRGPLHTSGNRVYDSNGNPVIFRGINRDGSEWSTARFPTEGEIAQAKAWGANFIRVPLNEALWSNLCIGAKPTNDPAYPGKVDSEVNWITTRGMVAMLDLHFSVTKACEAGTATAMADAQYAPGFWTQIASRYKSNPLVVFDLYNEPHDITDAVWLNGGTIRWNTSVYKTAGMQQLYNTVRATGATNLVFISGKDWANRPATTLVTGTNIVNGLHYYACPTDPPPKCTNPNPYDSSPGFNNWTTVAKTSPVMMTEFGWPDMKEGRYIQNVIDNAEARGWGWAVFAFDGTNHGLFGIVASTGSTYEPSPSGIPVVTGLMNNS